MERVFVHGRIDISKLLVVGESVLIMEVVRSRHPGAVEERNEMNTSFNEGILGYDNPMFHTTTERGWIFIIRRRNIGIWNDIYLSAEGEVSLADPMMTSCLNLPDTLATITPSVVLKNDESHTATRRLKGWVDEVKFEKAVTLFTLATMGATFNPPKFADLKSRRLRL